MNLDIENKILIPVLFLVIFPLLAVGLFYYRSSQNLFLENIEEELEKDLLEVKNIVDYDIGSEEEQINNIKKIKEIELLIYNTNNDEIIFDEFNNEKSEIKTLINKHNSLGEKKFNLQFDNKLYSFIQIEGLSWYIGSGEELSGLKSSLLEIHKYTILFAIIFLIIAVELTIFLAHNLSKPIRKLSEFCNIVSKGNYQQKVEMNRQDEFGLLANSFNEMVEKINESTKELKNLKEFNEDILRSTTTGIISIDSEGKIISINRAAQVILNNNKKIKDKIFKKLKNITIESLNKKESYNKIMEFFPDHDNSLIIEANTSFLTNEEGKINGALCSFNDITQRKLIEERIEEIDRLSSLGEISAALAHEIRNPLAGIKTSAEVLKGRFNDNNSKQLFNNVLSEIDRMNNLISDILNYAKPQEPEFKLINIKDKINETLSLMEKKFKNNSIQVNKNFPEENIYLKIDPKQLKQILINLYMNAVNAMIGSGKLEVSMTSINEEKIKITIKDNGKGIESENINKIFNPFFTTFPKGTGLGLAVVKRLVLENKGEIYVKSKKGQGSTFNIIFPNKGGNNE
ncbi:MAG: ATP-binding protein [Bacillota bacterium]